MSLSVTALERFKETYRRFVSYHESQYVMIGLSVSYPNAFGVANGLRLLTLDSVAATESSLAPHGWVDGRSAFIIYLRVF